MQLKCSCEAANSSTEEEKIENKQASMHVQFVYLESANVCKQLGLDEWMDGWLVGAARSRCTDRPGQRRASGGLLAIFLKRLLILNTSIPLCCPCCCFCEVVESMTFESSSRKTDRI